MSEANSKGARVASLSKKIALIERQVALLRVRAAERERSPAHRMQLITAQEQIRLKSKQLDDLRRELQSLQDGAELRGAKIDPNTILARMEKRLGP